MRVLLGNKKRAYSADKNAENAQLYQRVLLKGHIAKRYSAVGKHKQKRGVTLLPELLEHLSCKLFVEFPRTESNAASSQLRDDGGGDSAGMPFWQRRLFLQDLPLSNGAYPQAVPPKQNMMGIKTRGSQLSFQLNWLPRTLFENYRVYPINSLISEFSGTNRLSTPESCFRKRSISENASYPSYVPEIFSRSGSRISR